MCKDDAFEEIFELPIDEHFTPEPHKSAKDFDEIRKVFHNHEPEGLNPMQRFLCSDPKDEHIFLDSIRLMQVGCRQPRDPGDAIDSAERCIVSPSQNKEVNEMTLRALQRQGSGSTDRRRSNRHSLRHPHDSWYDPDSEQSSDDAEHSTIRHMTPSSAEMGVAAIMRNVIATFETAD